MREENENRLRTISSAVGLMKTRTTESTSLLKDSKFIDEDESLNRISSLPTKNCHTSPEMKITNFRTFMLLHRGLHPSRRRWNDNVEGAWRIGKAGLRINLEKIELLHHLWTNGKMEHR